MPVTKIDENARKVLERVRDQMKAEGITHPNLSETIRYMEKKIADLESRVETLEKRKNNDQENTS